MATRIFAAYPSKPPEIGQSYNFLDNDSNLNSSGIHFSSWEAHSESGRLIDDNILPHIKAADLVLVDVTFHNPNVFFEAGYAIGLGKPIIPLINSGINSTPYLRKLGVFDNVVYQSYDNHKDIKSIILKNLTKAPVANRDRKIDHSQPVFVLDAFKRTEFASKIISAVKEAKLFFRSHDPAEIYRLGLREAFRSVDSSTGVILSYLSQSKTDWELHNIKSAFLFGLSVAMSKETLFIVDGDLNVPLDFVDYVKTVKHPEDISQYISKFEKKVNLENFKQTLTNRVATSDLQDVSMGSSAAENEFRDLKNYFVKTAAFKAALQGRGRIIVGRKGSGKTAIFWQVRDILRTPKKNLVLDLKPEGYQLQKFKEFSINHLSSGTKSHAITAFWEYVIFSELVRKIFENDERYYGKDPQISERLDTLKEIYADIGDGIEGDFSERLLHLINEVTSNFRDKKGISDTQDLQMSDAEITSLIYKTSIRKVHKSVSEYLGFKDEVLVLIDNIDKGWGSNGITHDDLIIVRSLTAALERVQKLLVKSGVNFRWLLFLRNDVYELLVNEQSDRGKDEKVLVDWESREALRNVINNRINYGIKSGERKTFNDFAVSKIEGQDSLTWLIDRCVMRPRYLINIVDNCFGQASMAGHKIIDEDDIELAFKSSSIDIISDTNFEMRDVMPSSFDSIYALIGCKNIITPEDLLKTLEDFDVEAPTKVMKLLHWFGICGFIDTNGAKKFIYDFRYDEKIYQMYMKKSLARNNVLVINPAYQAGLECELVE